MARVNGYFGGWMSMGIWYRGYSLRERVDTPSINETMNKSTDNAKDRSAERVRNEMINGVMEGNALSLSL